MIKSMLAKVRHRRIERLLGEDQVVIQRSPNAPGDLVGAVEASEILGVERTRIARYVKTGVMPDPVSKCRATKVWLRRDVEMLAASRALNGRRLAAQNIVRKVKEENSV